MKVLIIGASGQVGGSLARVHLQNGDVVETTYSTYQPTDFQSCKIDITDFDLVARTVLCYEPDVVYLTAALTNVDFCELNPQQSKLINIQAVKNIVDTVKLTDSKLIFFSTDYVFDGVEGFYNENDIPNPINQYGRDKLTAEHYIATHLSNYLIVRTNCVYGYDSQRRNFSSRLIASLKSARLIQLPVDEYCTPIDNKILAKSVALCSINERLIHIAGDRLINRYRFGIEIANQEKLNHHLIQPVRSDELKRAARRPLNGGLDCRRYGRLIGL